jgi:hypothetical protein
VRARLRIQSVRRLLERLLFDARLVPIVQRPPAVRGTRRCHTYTLLWFTQRGMTVNHQQKSVCKHHSFLQQKNSSKRKSGLSISDPERCVLSHLIAIRLILRLPIHLYLSIYLPIYLSFQYGAAATLASARATMAITTAVWIAVTLAFVIAVTAMLLRSRRPLLRLLQLGTRSYDATIAINECEYFEYFKS